MDGTASRALRVVVWSKPACPLCDELLAELALLAAEFPHDVEMRNILDVAADFERFRYLIPVFEVEGGALHYPPHTPGSVRAALLEARHSAPQPSAQGSHGRA